MNDCMVNHHFVLYKKEFNVIAKAVYDKFGLEYEHVNIALFPYLQII